MSAKTWSPQNYDAYTLVAVDRGGNLTATIGCHRIDEVKVGTASNEPDGSITVQLFTMPIDGRLQLRPRNEPDRG